MYICIPLYHIKAERNHKFIWAKIFICQDRKLRIRGQQGWVFTSWLLSALKIRRLCSLHNSRNTGSLRRQWEQKPLLHSVPRDQAGGKLHLFWLVLCWVLRSRYSTSGPQCSGSFPTLPCAFPSTHLPVWGARILFHSKGQSGKS